MRRWRTSSELGVAVAGVYACARKRDKTVDESGEGVVQLCAVSVVGGGGKTDRAIPSLRSLRRTLTPNIRNSSLRLLLRLSCAVTQSQHGTQRRPLNPPQHAQQSLGQRLSCSTGVVPQLLPHSPVLKYSPRTHPHHLRHRHRIYHLPPLLLPKFSPSTTSLTIPVTTYHHYSVLSDHLHPPTLSLVVPFFSCCFGSLLLRLGLLPWPCGIRERRVPSGVGAWPCM